MTKARVARSRRLAPATAVAVAAAVTYSWLAADLRPFTWPMRVAVAVPILLAVVVAWERSDQTCHARTASGNARPVGSAVWGLLFAALAVWQLAAYLSSPRVDHPTLSSLANDVMRTHLGRAAVFAAWLVLGAVLFARRQVVPR